MLKGNALTGCEDVTAYLSTQRNVDIIVHMELNILMDAEEARNVGFSTQGYVRIV
jgi:hypothetical protein